MSYMAIFGLQFVIQGMTGPLVAGLIMDNGDPRWVWYDAAILGIVSALVFLYSPRRAAALALSSVPSPQLAGPGTAP